MSGGSWDRIHRRGVGRREAHFFAAGLSQAARAPATPDGSLENGRIELELRVGGAGPCAYGPPASSGLAVEWWRGGRSSIVVPFQSGAPVNAAARAIT